MNHWHMLLIICPLVFLAGFVDSIAGGGGLISLPAYLLVGLPAHMAAGTNKVVSSIGTSASVFKYMKSGKVKLDIALFAAAGALAGGGLGSYFVVGWVSDSVLKTLMLIALPAVAVFLAVKRDFGKEPELREMSKTRARALSVLIGFGIGCYDGVVGPGTGTFMIMAFTAVLGLDLLTSSGCAKVSNLASNVASSVVFLAHGQVLLPVVAPAAVCCMAGHYLGARYAVRGGSGKVRAMIYVVLALLFARTIAEIVM